MSCPRCEKSWRRVEGNQLICDGCGLKQIIPTAKPTYEQLEKEVETQKETIKQLNKKLSNIP